MSGFAGMISLDGAPPDRSLLEKMATRLAFRGPDGTHIKTLPGAGFCFTFLRTGPAPQCPSQPCTLDGRVWLLGDVRLDGRDDVRRKLEQSGEELSAEVTDEELVLRAWRLWGEAGIAELIGDYAFALWDAEARQLRCWRDLMGSRPFFYAQAGGWFYFSNTLNAIRCAPGISRDLDHHFIGDFLLIARCDYPSRTVFRDIARVPGGYVARLYHPGLQIRRFSSLPIEEPLRLKREEDYVARFRQLFEEAILDRLPQQGAAAIYMSGGMDSTSVAAMARSVSVQRGQHVDLCAYTLDYRPLFDDQEGRLATIAARHIGIPIEVQDGSSCLPFANWGIGSLSTPEPYHEPFRYLYVTQARLISQRARIAFTGNGGDGVMNGQSWPYFLDLLRNRRFVEIARTFGGYVVKHGRIPPLRGGFRSTFRHWVKPQDPMEGYPKWLMPEFEMQIGLRDRWNELQRPLETVHPWHPTAYAGLSHPFWSGFLESEGPEWTGVPIDPRAPLFDLRIQRFLLRVAPVPLCVNKELLRRALRGLLPKEILARPKTPFQSDLVALQTGKHKWSPLPLAAPPESLKQFLSWERLGCVLESEPNVFPWSNLLPISFMHWLQGVENNRASQYCQIGEDIVWQKK
jgi:asparagine synthase (glutamine-hydrolysing)